MKRRAAGFAICSLACSLAVLLSSAIPASGKATAPASAKATVVKVTAGKPSLYRFTLSLKSVKHGTVIFKLTNVGVLPHDLKICSSSKGGTANTCTGKATPLITRGQTASLTVKFARAGKYEYLCTFPGHAALGMKGDLKVT